MTNDSPMPLMHPKEIEYILSVLMTMPKDAHVLEFGMGASTLFLANHLGPTQHLYSVEHNLEWFCKVNEVLERDERMHLQYRPNSLHLDISCADKDGNHIKPETLSLSRFLMEESSAGYGSYLNMHYGNDWKKTPLVIVDGVVRGACLAMLHNFVRQGTTVLLHDWASIPTSPEPSREEWYNFGASLFTRVRIIDTMLVLQA